LDFKYPAERAIQRQFELSHIHHFIRNYVTHINYFYDLSESKPLRFFITLRPGPYEDKKSNTLNRSIKDGVHIECPDLILPSEHQQVLRHRSLEHNDLGQSFKNTGYINPEKDIFDEAIVKKNGWFFYGESKPDIPAYHLASVYVYDPQQNELYEESKDDYSPRQLLELLSIRYNLRYQSIEFEEKTHDEWKEYLDYCTGKKSLVQSIQQNNDNEDEKNTGTTIQITSSNVHEQLEKDKMADLLLMSATPIPRTLAMSDFGHLDHSLLKEKPAKRKKIITSVLNIARISEIFEKMKDFMSRREKIYWICPLIEESLKLDLIAIEKRFELLKAEFGEEQIGVIHGKMKEAEINEIMAKFKNGEKKTRQ